jgi:hypothetical protein
MSNIIVQLGNKQVVLATPPNSVDFSKCGTRNQAVCHYNDRYLLLSQNCPPNGHVNETWTFHSGGSFHPQSGTYDAPNPSILGSLGLSRKR